MTPEPLPTTAERLRQVEARAQLFSERYEGWSPWRVMRNVVDRTAAGMPVTLSGRSAVRRAFEAIFGGLSLAAVLMRGRRVELLVKTARSALREERMGRFRDVNFDGLLDSAEGWLKIEEDNAPAFAARARRADKPAQLNASTFTLFGRVMGKVAPASVEGFARRAHATLTEEFDVVPSVDTLRMRVSTVRWQARLFGLLLRRVKPRAVLVSDTGEYALILACRRAGVPVIELQHGLFDALHPDAAPLAEGTAEALLVPHALASRSRYWISQLSGTHHGLVASAVGSEALDRARNTWSARAADQVFRIVVASQGLDLEALAAWLSAAAAAAPEGREWQMTIKLHPTYDLDTRAFDELAEHPRVTVVSGAATPSLLELLTAANLHLSISSAGHFDALALGVPSGVIPLKSWQDVAAAIEEGRLVRLDDPAELWSSPWDPLDTDQASFYCEADFSNKMRGLIGQLAGME
jgi:hypothetical protein